MMKRKRGLCYTLVLMMLMMLMSACSVAGKSYSTKSGYAKNKKSLKIKKKSLKFLDIKEFIASTADIGSSHFMRIKLKLAYESGNIKLMTELSARKLKLEI